MEKQRKNTRRNKGITLIALVITIIILLILAGISIAQLTGNGLFENAKLAKEKSDNVQQKENDTLSDYENKIGEYIDGTRQNTTTNVLWEGNTSSGTLELAESIYNYDFLIIIADSYIQDIIYINKEGMDKIYGGPSYAYTDTNIVGYWGFYISSISDDGEELVLTKSGAASSSATWSTNYNITKVIGLKY